MIVTPNMVNPVDFEVKFKIKGLEEFLEWQPEAIVEQFMDSLRLATYYTWQNIARQKLHKSRDTYIASMSNRKTSPTSFVISIGNDFGGEPNPLPSFVEFGRAVRDMKKDLIYGGKGPKISKKGVPYKVIPFQFAVTDKGTGSRLEIPPEDILNQIKMLRKQGGGVLKNVNKYYTQNEVTGYISQVSKFERLQVRKTGKKSTSATTFRTVSGKSDPSSWYHKGIVPRMIHQDVFAIMNTEIVPAALGAGFSFKKAF